MQILSAKVQDGKEGIPFHACLGWICVGYGEIRSVSLGHSHSLDSEAGTRQHRKCLLWIKTLPPVVLM